MDTKREGRENAGNQLRCRGCRILNSWRSDRFWRLIREDYVLNMKREYDNLGAKI